MGLITIIPQINLKSHVLFIGYPCVGEPGQVNAVGPMEIRKNLKE